MLNCDPKLSFLDPKNNQRSKTDLIALELGKSGDGEEAERRESEEESRHHDDDVLSIRGEREDPRFFFVGYA